MRSVPELSGALTPSLRSGEGGRRTHHGLAETWVRQAIVAGCNPFMRQEPLASDDWAGEWLLVISFAGRASPLHPGTLPNALLDDVFLVLARLGRVMHDKCLKPWHGNVLLDDSSSRSIAFRLRLVREALSMGVALFYGACGIDSKAGEAIEKGCFSLLSPDQAALQAICTRYDIPEEWITQGAAEEIEA